MQTDSGGYTGTFRRLWRRSLLVMICVTSVSFRPWAMAVGPRVEYSVTTVKFKPGQTSQSSQVLYEFRNVFIHWSFFLSLTWEVVHEAGLCCHNPLSSGLTEDGDVTLRLLAESCQPTPETLCCGVGFLIRQPVIFPKNYLHTHNEREHMCNI